MQPEDIRNRDFFVGLRGYDKAEVNGFLAEVAACYQDLLVELQEAKAQAGVTTSLPPTSATPPPQPQPQDEIAELGNAVVSVLQAARDQAAEILRNAQTQADFALEHARSEAARIRAEAIADVDRTTSGAA